MGNGMSFLRTLCPLTPSSHLSLILASERFPSNEPHLRKLLRPLDESMPDTMGWEV